MTNRKIDWQKLAKNLQKALEKEIDESEQHRKWCLEWREKYESLMRTVRKKSLS